MSSLKTEQYQLHQWEPGDSVLREEFNENFAKLDVSTRLFFGSYTGDGGAEKVINLGFQPTAVLLLTRDSKINVQYGSYCINYGGLAFPGVPLYADNTPDIAMEVTDDGFVAYHNVQRYFRCNQPNMVYYYLVLR